MKSARSPEVHFTDACHETETKPAIGGLVTKLCVLADDAARSNFGDTFFPNPSDIELTPLVTEDGVSVIVRAWHQTSGDKPAVFQAHDTSFTLDLVGEDAYLKTEDLRSYALTTREALLVQQLSIHATMHALSSSMES